MEGELVPVAKVRTLLGTRFQVGKDVSAPDLAYLVCREFDATRKELARVFGVELETIVEWIRNWPEFADAVRRGKDDVDTNVVKKSFHKRAKGYSYQEVTKERKPIFGMVETPRGQKYTQTGVSDELVVTKTVTKHIPPDPIAGMFWLKNKLRDEFKDKQDLEVNAKHEITVVSKIPEPRALPEGV